MDIERQLNASESFLQSISDGVLKSTSGFAKTISNIPTETIKGTIFAARDALGSVTGLMIKFKPWEVTKMAGTVSKWAGPVGAMIS